MVLTCLPPRPWVMCCSCLTHCCQQGAVLQQVAVAVAAGPLLLGVEGRTVLLLLLHAAAAAWVVGVVGRAGACRVVGPKGEWVGGCAAGGGLGDSVEHPQGVLAVEGASQWMVVAAAAIRVEEVVAVEGQGP